MIKQIFVSLLFLAAPFISGCRNVSYIDPAGRKISVTTIAIDSKFGKMQGSLPDGTKFEIDSFDANSDAALGVINTAISKIPVPAVVPVP